MGAFAGASLCTHIPRLMISDPAQRQAYLTGAGSSFFAAFDALWAEKIEPLDFDTFVVVDTHWFSTIAYVVNGHERLRGLYTSDELPELMHEYAYDYAGNPVLADLIGEEANDNSGGRLRCVVSRHKGLPVHYPTLTPMHYLNRRHDKKVVSLSVCQTSEPHNDLAFGEAIGRAVKRYPGRVVFVASGGLSHKFHKYDRIVETRAADPVHIWSPLNREMDYLVMTLLKEGRHRELVEMAPSYRAACTPEANFAHYLMMAGAHGGAAWTAKGTQYGQYENAIGTGQANFWFDASPS